MSYTLDILNEYIVATNATVNLNELSKLSSNSIIPFICNCGKEGSKTFKRIKFSGVLCNDCTQISRRNKRETTNLERYGATCSLQSPVIKQKAEETTINKYGVNNVFKLKDIQHKIKERNIEKYGVENPFASTHIIQKIRNTCKEKYGTEFPMQTNEISTKVQNTNLAKYGVSVSSKAECVKQKTINTNMERYGKPHHIVPEVLSKIYATNLKKYGFKYTCQVPSIQAKIKETHMKKYGYINPFYNKQLQQLIRRNFKNKYGVEWPMQLNSVKEKRDSTNIIRFGTKYPMQNKYVQIKQQQNALKYKEYICPSGEKRLIQGYEHFALNKLINEMNISETDIITNREYIPIITYYYNDKQCKYFPDIFITSSNKIIEVKSHWTYKLHEAKNIEKWKATRNAGYNCEFWIFTKDGKLDCINDPLSGS